MDPQVADLLRRLADALELELEDCERHEPTFHVYAIGLVCEARTARAASAS